MKNLIITVIQDVAAVVILVALAWLLAYEPPKKPPRPMSNVTGTVVHEDRYCYSVEYDNIESRFEHSHLICFPYKDPRFE